MNGLDHAIEKVTRTLCIAGGWVLIALSLATVASAILRKFFGTSLQGVDEYGGYILAVVAAIGFSHALVKRAHVRIELLRQPLPPRAQALVDLFALLALLFTAIVLVWVAIGVVRSTVAMDALSNTPLRTPLVIPQSIWAGALGFFALISLILFVRCVAAFIRGDIDFVRRRLGSETLDEEITRVKGDLAARGTAEEIRN
ncbi:TRAP transporter small permease [Acuticoccus sp. MNP-M23]|uniref:TRAP transporter small permease subunit n=1 Tax=Acuticoccus sp. MNP-M23 TaxID=3072793 RepID=UPI002814B6D5|nr:TRAP transporter small permease [Acuticoccus sp. MNP-M23]WMS43546.1 TRAP transporter small permease [Acuticoccus sp. MNP-M23]